MAQIDVYYSFRSPYSYLATHRLEDLAARYDLRVDVRVVLPIAVRDPDFFDQVNPMWPPYLMRDTRRLGEFLGVPFRWPRPDPVVTDRETGRFPKEQPYIWRISRLGVAAQERGAGLAFTCAASQMMWSGEVDDWHEGDHLDRVASGCGLDFAELEAATREDPERYDATIAANQDALRAVGHWGVPTFVFEGEPFFGQDRLDVLEWRLRNAGVAER